MSDKVCLLRIGDGRDDVHERSWESLKAALPSVHSLVTVDDASHELGFAGAIAEGWRQVRESRCDFVFHAELDFLYLQPIALDRMVRVLKARPYLAQLVLKRGPVNAEESAAGGVVEMWPDEYQQVTDRGDVWTEHRLFWSTNPALYSVGWCWQEWPQVEGSERAFSDRLLEDGQLRFAFWGPKFAPPAVEHIGERIGVGY